MVRRPGAFIGDERFRYDAHTHSTFSDGRNTVMENARAAEAVGLETVVITDHMFDEPEWLEEMLIQVEYADAACGVKVLAGAEGVILNPNGDISIPPHVAERLDFVLVDFGSRTDGIGHNAPADQGRLLRNVISAITKACENPHVDAIAHPLNLGRFPAVMSPIDFDSTSLIEIATAFEETGTAFEIMNQLPWWFPEHSVSRITAEYADLLRLFARFRVEFVVGSDAHSCGAVGNLGWCRRVMELAGIGFDRLIDLPTAGQRRR
ncbi:MAG: PHP domain-containing protein [Candidatus Zipacnadales bacterium]